MIIAKKLEMKSQSEAEELDWRKMTHEYNLEFIEAFIAMQPSCREKLAVADIILNALHRDQVKSFFMEEIATHIQSIKGQLENGVFSPYSEIQRLIDEGKYKDRQIDEKVAELEILKKTGNEVAETSLLNRIIQEAKTLGPLGALYTEVMLRRIYPDDNGTLDELKACIRDDCRAQYTFNAPVGVVC